MSDAMSEATSVPRRIALSTLLLARAAQEDRFPRGNLPGGADHAAPGRFRLLPGVW